MYTHLKCSSVIGRELPKNNVIVYFSDRPILKRMINKVASTAFKHHRVAPPAAEVAQDFLVGRAICAYVIRACSGGRMTYIFLTISKRGWGML